MTGKAVETVDVLRRRKVGVACVQEVKWKGSKARNTGHGMVFEYFCERNEGCTGDQSDK